MGIGMAEQKAAQPLATPRRRRDLAQLTTRPKHRIIRINLLHQQSAVA
jgi:hypothetical protein